MIYLWGMSTTKSPSPAGAHLADLSAPRSVTPQGSAPTGACDPVFTWLPRRRRIEVPVTEAEQYADFCWLYWHDRSYFVRALDAFRAARESAFRPGLTRIVELPANSLYVAGCGWAEMPGVRS